MSMRTIAPWLVVAVFQFHASVKPLPPPVRAEISGRFWHAGCPVPLSQLRVLTVTYWGFDARPHNGQMIVNAEVAHPLVKVFHRLYAMRFPIHHMSLKYMYGPAGTPRPRDGDFTGSFSCRQAVPSPCSGGSGTGSWSMHAYGEAIDVNDVENPYIEGGRVIPPAGKAFVNRSRVRPGMAVAGRVLVNAFARVGWGWGGHFAGTPDYQHFSVNGR
jgi:hypothetical protein